MTTTLRTCQTEAIACVESRRHTMGSDTNLSLCTGAGKTVIIRLCSLLTGGSRVILVFPSLLLLQQYIGKKAGDSDDRTFRAAYAGKSVYYFATEDSKKRRIPRLSDTFTELSSSDWIVLTTYISAPRIYGHIAAMSVLPLVIHDEAHHITAPLYASAFSTIADKIHCINLSATLPDVKSAHYKYPLLKGIRDGVVRDFNLDLFLCVDVEEHTTALLKLIINKLLGQHPVVKLLLYTREANTTGEGSSSVHTFLTAHAAALTSEGWWVKGIKEDTTNRDELLDEFETNGSTVSVLVSCRTLSEGVDLKGANCMLPWDPTASIVDNIQRIGRVLRLYKGQKEQPPSTVLIPVFLSKAEFTACGGDKDAIHTLLESQIREGERGNFRPLVNVCTALKSELAEEDAELFNTLLNYPHRPKVAVNRGLMECVAKACKKSVGKVVEEVSVALEEKGEEEAAEVVCGDGGDESETDMALNEDLAGPIVAALAETQGIQLVVRDGKETEMYGNCGPVITVEKKADGAYSVVKSGTKKAVADLEAAKKRIAHRMRVNFSDECQILLGLDTVEGADEMGGMVLTKLTTEVRVDEDWEKRRLEWVAMYEKLGRVPSKESIDIDEKTIGIWASNQRTAFKNKEKRMTEERVSVLNLTKGWYWEKEDPWESNFQNWITQYKLLGKNPSKRSKNTNEKKAGIWQVKQRLDYRNNSPRLTSVKIKLLEETPGWKWEQEDTWEHNRLHWIEQKIKLGRTPYEASIDPDENRAGHWQQNQRQNYKKKESCMTPERIKILEETPGWKWDEEDTWCQQLLHWKSIFSKYLRSPSTISSDSEEKKAGQWQSNQRNNYKKKYKCMTPERIKILEETDGWKWEEDTWTPNLHHWIQQFSKLGRSPSQGTKDLNEKKAAIWQTRQRMLKKKTDPAMTPDRIAILNATPGWSWSATEAPVTPYVAADDDTDTTSSVTSYFSSVTTCGTDTIELISAEEPTLPIKKERKRRTEKGPKEFSVEKESPIARKRSALEEYHKRFKTMNAATYAGAIATNPADFTTYHAIADTYDARDPPERQPLKKITDLLVPFNKPSYSAIDLGCGQNRLRSQFEVSRMKWTSVDVHAVDATVTVADMGALPFEEETFDIAVMGRSLWARNHREVLLETQRILKIGGRVVICESFKRWLSDKSENSLLLYLEEIGFTILYKEGTSVTDDVDDVFQYIVAQKK